MRSRRSGFTLIEVMLVVSILGVLVVMSAPKFDSMYRNYKMISLARSYMTGIAEARAAAIRHGRLTQLAVVERRFVVRDSLGVYWQYPADPDQFIDASVTYNQDNPWFNSAGSTVNDDGIEYNWWNTWLNDKKTGVRYHITISPLGFYTFEIVK